MNALPWTEAAGVGIVLGAASQNIAVIDIDNPYLGALAVGTLTLGRVKTRIVQTISKNFHIYVQEETPSPGGAVKVVYRGQKIGIDLKAQGGQVAAPPTDGYTLVADHPPMKVPSIRDAWLSLASRLPIEMPAASSSAGYPHAWAEHVEAGERNNALFIEACKLREAQMPMDEALEIIKARIETGYDPGMSWREVERTVRSAYARGNTRPLWETYSGESGLLK
jgi:hypothetical protein